MIRSNPQELLRKCISRFVDQELKPRAQEIDDLGEFPAEIIRELGQMGVFGIRYPKKHGGAGGNTTLYCIICEELARGLMSVAAISAMQSLMGTNFLFKFGTEQMRQEYFHPAMRGEKISCFCLTEPEAGSDLANVRTRAKKVQDGYIVDGRKSWVTNGPVGDFFTVLCQTDPEKKFKGLNFFFVPGDHPGVSRSKPFDLLGTRTTKICEVSFNNCHIPEHFRLGGEGEGVDNLMSILSEIRAMTASLGIGLQRAALDDCIRYAHEREQFGRPISKFQLIRAKVSNMATDLEASKLMTYRATSLIDQNISCLKESTMAKYFSTEAACRAGDEATRIFGAYGYSKEYPAQRYFRDNRFLLYGGGTHEILQNNIAQWVGL